MQLSGRKFELKTVAPYANIFYRVTLKGYVSQAQLISLKLMEQQDYFCIVVSTGKFPLII